MTDREKAPPWTDEEIGFLLDHDSWSARRIAEELGRSGLAVKSKRTKLRNGWTRKVEPWTEDEDQLLLEIGLTASAEQLADRFPSRTPGAIRDRRTYLGLSTNFGSFDSHAIGARPLLAKTCISCEKLLQADWFTYHAPGRYWRSRCRKCLAGTMVDWRTETGYTRSGDQIKSKEFRARMNTLTRSKAERHGEPYTDSDHEILADPDLTALQKALRIGRTYGAVSNACRRNGYKSHVGLGEPTDLWRIFNPNEPEQVAA